MSQNETKVIKNYKDLNALLQQTEKQLNAKVKKGYWLRYLLRRVPLYSATGLIFFLVCLAMTMVEQIGFKVVEHFLKTAIPFNYDHNVCVFIRTLVVLLVLMLALGTTLKDIKSKAIWIKFSIHGLLTLLFLVGSSITITSQNPLLFGLTAFSTVTFSSMLFDKVLGVTRSNERYQLFADRALGLQILYASKEQLKTPFTESYLLEIEAFYDELRKSKFNDTISDSNYLLSCIERFKNAQQ